MTIASRANIAATTALTTGQGGWLPTSNAACNAEDLVVFTVASINQSDVTSTGVTDEHLTLSFGGVSFTKAAEYTFYPGADTLAVTVSVWWGVLPGAVSSGSTITIDFDALMDARAITGRAFTRDAAKVIQAGATPVANTQDDSSSPEASSITVADGHHLLYRGWGKIGTSTTNLTATAGWTAVTAATANSGSGVSSAGVRAEFKAFDGSGAQTSDPTGPFTIQAADLLVDLVEVSAWTPRDPIGSLTGFFGN